MKGKWVIVGAVLLALAVAVGVMLHPSAEPVDAQFGPFSGEVTALEMDIGAAEVRIVAGEALRAETDNPYITAKVQNGTLVIRERSHVAGLESSELIVYIPAEMVFDRVELENGAGRITAERLSCRELDMELGAGEAVFELLTVTGGAEISGGTGRIALAGSVHDLEFHMGVGEAELRLNLTGETELSAGVGALNVTVPDMAMEDYTIHVEQGIGQVLLNGSAQSGSAGIGTGENHIDIEGGIGNVEIDFGG